MFKYILLTYVMVNGDMKFSPYVEIYGTDRECLDRAIEIYHEHPKNELAACSLLAVSQEEFERNLNVEGAIIDMIRSEVDVEVHSEGTR